MDSTHPLKALLQLQLASDSSAALNLPYVLSCITSDSLRPSPHLSKWTTRINSLIHSKDTSGRWAGLCLATKTSALSKTVMIDCAQSWLGAALPMLLKNEAVPVLKSSVRLLRIIFSAAIDVPEFQRQVTLPNVPKFTVALMNIAEKHEDLELKILALSTLAQLIPLFPTLHRASYAALSSLSLSFLNGRAYCPTDGALLESASRLFAILHFTGGKVGAANLWRKSVDETLVFGWNAFIALRSTFPNEGRNQLVSHDDPSVSISLNLDRLRCTVAVLCHLMRSTTHRPVQLPIGPLTNFTIGLLSSTGEKIDGHVDLMVHTMELSVIPALRALGCQLLTCLAKCARHNLTSGLVRLVTCLTFHLEEKITASERLPILDTLHVLLTNCHPLHSPLTSTRLMKALLPSISVILIMQSDISNKDEGSATSKSKKGKKRARGYEGDEIFKISREVICPTVDDGNVLLAALEVMLVLIPNRDVLPPVHSLASRLILAVLLALPQMSPTLLSPDPSLYGRVFRKAQDLSVEVGSGSTSTLSQGLGLVLATALTDDDHNHHKFDIMLHPRVPPLVRSLPHVESLSLFRAEESHEETEARETSGIVVLPAPQPSVQEHITMETSPINPPVAPRIVETAMLPISQGSPSNGVLSHSLPPPVSSQLSVSIHQQTKPVESPSVPPPEPPLGRPAATTQSNEFGLQPDPDNINLHLEVVEDEDEEMPAIDLQSDSDSD